MMQSADCYIDSNSLQKKDVRALLEEFLPRLHWQDQEETVLDVGCGPGDITRHILLPALPHNCSLTGIDLSPQLIEHACSENKNSRLSFKVVDFGSKNIAESLNTQIFSKIFSFFCIHWIFDQRQALRNVNDLLKPGGEAVMIAITKIPGMTVFKQLATMDMWSSYMKDIHTYFPLYCMSDEGNVEEKMSALLMSEGLQHLVCEERDFTHIYASLSVLIDSWIAVGPWKERIPHDLRERFREDMIRLTLEHPLCHILQDSTAKLSYKVLVIHCRKPVLMKPNKSSEKTRF